MTLDVFSKRNKPMPDVYVYDAMPQALRVQLVHLLGDTLGTHFTRGHGSGWEWLAKAIAKEHGLLQLPQPSGHFGQVDERVDCLNYVLNAVVPRALDLVEIAFRFIDSASADQGFAYQSRINADVARSALDELNHRFKEHGCGYQFEGKQIVRVDSQLLHAEAVRPTLAFLSARGFEGPNGEFLAAHEHLRHGRTEPAMTEACKAFESTMKAICSARKWKYDAARATANTLIKLLIEKELIPRYSEEQLIFVEKSLVGVATLRNKDAGHGAGAKPRDVPPHFATYALHLAASNILFLMECHQAK